MSKRPVESKFGGASTSRSAGPSHGFPSMPPVGQLLEALQNDATREEALQLLQQYRVTLEDMAPVLWHSIGTMATLVQEVISVYRLLYTPRLTERESSRVCNALTLLQCVAAHPETKTLFLKANIPMYLYPFLNTMGNEKPLEHLRVKSLFVIGALVKVDDIQVVRYLVRSQIFPSCLHCMEVGDNLSKMAATFIVYRILINDEGLKYCCTLAERFYGLGRVLGNMVAKLARDGKLFEDPSKQLLKHIIFCYHRLSEHPRACNGLRRCLPRKLADSTFISVLHDDIPARLLLQQLFHNLSSAFHENTPAVQQLLGRLLAVRINEPQRRM